MAIYIVGDIQGCFAEFQALLKQVNFCVEKDEIWPAGDVVARGPDSLKTLRYLKSLGSSAKMVLGNHDLHLLAIHAGLKKAKKSDLLDELLAAPDLDALMHWLAQQPLIRKLPTGSDKDNAYVSHAGISPQWTLAEALAQARRAQQKLSSAQRNQWLACMYGEKPNSWPLAISEEEQFRFTINAFTRMRFCFADGSLEFNEKQAPNKNTSPLIPWYQNNPTLENNHWLFGHWASLMGECAHPNVYALDTGCVWGNYLSLLKWPEKQIFTVFSHNSN